MTKDQKYNKATYIYMSTFTKDTPKQDFDLRCDVCNMNYEYTEELVEIKTRPHPKTNHHKKVSLYGDGQPRKGWKCGCGLKAWYTAYREMHKRC